MIDNMWKTKTKTNGHHSKTRLTCLRSGRVQGKRGESDSLAPLINNAEMQLGLTS